MESSGIPNIIHTQYNTNHICWTNRSSFLSLFVCMSVCVHAQTLIIYPMHTRMSATKWDYVWISKDFYVADCVHVFVKKSGYFLLLDSNFLFSRFFAPNFTPSLVFGVSLWYSLVTRYSHTSPECATICAIFRSSFFSLGNLHCTYKRGKSINNIEKTCVEL